jgi:hypothetical protein
MEDYLVVRKEMLKDPVEIRVDREQLDFPRAKEIADKKAAEIGDQPMLLAWFDRKTGASSPTAVCSREDDRPGWLAYAESRGGNITVDINGEEYVFIYQGEIRPGAKGESSKLKAES